MRGPVPPVRLSPLYRVGLVLVALAMVLLPVVYLGLIGLAVWGIVWYAQAGLYVFHARTRSAGALLVYVGPLLLGGLLVLFMIKPLFAPRPRRDEDKVLSRDDEPLLFDFVERVCEAVGAPRPREIRVDRDVNASASFRRGVLSLVTGDLALTIGLPLAAGMTVQQFAGVLAHEFGHFAQRVGMRLTYLIRSINLWFLRVVYERDAWDARLAAWSKDTDWRVAVVLSATRFGVWLTRKVLWVLMWVGNLLSCFMLRQMEYDADRYEARLAGGATFEATMRRLAELSAAHRMAIDDLSASWDEGRLADDLPALIVADADRMPESLRESVRRHAAESTTGLWNTHPAPRDRVAGARREDSPGVFRDAGAAALPAGALFRDFPGLCRAVTAAYYREVLGPSFNPDALRPVAELVARRAGAQEAEATLGRYFLGVLCPLRPLPLPDAPPDPSVPGEDAAAARAARERMRAAAAAYGTDVRRYDEADTAMLHAARARALIAAGFRIEPKQFGLVAATASDATRARRAAVARQKELDPRLRAFEIAAAERLAAALRLLHAGPAEGAGDRLQEAAVLLNVARLVRGLAPDLIGLRDAYQGLAVQCAQLEDHAEDQTLIAAIRAGMADVRDKVAAFHDALGGVPYPFDHARPDAMLREYALARVPPADDLEGLMGAAAGLLDRLFGVQGRALARLAQIAEQAEAAAGLPPLPPLEPPHDPPPVDVQHPTK